MQLTVSDFTLIPQAGRSSYNVYRGMTMIGSVEKDATGNWVARDSQDRKLSEFRAVRDGEREFNYFASRKAAVMAIYSAVK